MNNAERLLETLEMSFGESRSDDWRCIARARAGGFPNPRDEVDEVESRLKERIAPSPAVFRLIGAIGISRCDLHREIARAVCYRTIKTFRASSAIVGRD